ncbi:MAG: hypothetical protein Q8N15_00370 [Bacillota bacterium]|nr:hypothetical protein [Bacillota bacterium]
MPTIEGNEIIVRVENILIGGDGNGGEILNGGSQAGSLPSQKKSGSGFAGGISAHLAVTYASRIIGAAGNQELANGIRETAEWGFLGMRVVMGDPTAVATAALKLAAKAAGMIRDYIDGQRAIAAEYNERDMLLMRYGVISIKAGTEISYGKWKRLTFTDRK